MAEQPTILALDFDGVICDGMLEYFQVSWQTYCQAWNITEEPPEGLAEGFYRTRPVIETGWEMPVLIRALIQNISEAEILQNWPAVLTRLVEQAKPDASTLGPLLDQVRDQWIQQDLTGWLALHRFYPGVTDHLKRMLASPIKLVIITTKEERFTRSLLQQADLEMPEGTVFGKGHKRPK
ncbi:MAG: HAD family hydrolase [Microcoleaceae cyanobacterium]